MTKHSKEGTGTYRHVIAIHVEEVHSAERKAHHASDADEEEREVVAFVKANKMVDLPNSFDPYLSDAGVRVDWRQSGLNVVHLFEIQASNLGMITQRHLAEHSTELG